MRILFIFVFVAVAGVFLARDMNHYFTRRADSAAVVSPTAAQPTPPPANVSAYRTVTLNRDGRGHFAVEARVDGRRIEFMVDTGASTIALRESAAARLGIFPKPSDYTAGVQTANGIVKVAPVRLNKVDVNGIVVHDVDAAVVPDDALKENLLGMSFLSKVKFSHDRGRLVLEQ